MTDCHQSLYTCENISPKKKQRILV